MAIEFVATVYRTVLATQTGLLAIASGTQGGMMSIKNSFAEIVQ